MIAWDEREWIQNSFINKNNPLTPRLTCNYSIG